jgi:hypothetical protein
VPLRLVSFGADAGSRIPAPGEYARSESQPEVTLPRVDNALHGYSPPRKKTFGPFGKAGEDQLKTLAQMFHWFNKVTRNDVKGLHGFLTYLHDGTVEFVREWYSATARAEAR